MHDHAALEEALKFFKKCNLIRIRDNSKVKSSFIIANFPHQPALRSQPIWSALQCWLCWILFFIICVGCHGAEGRDN